MTTIFDVDGQVHSISYQLGESITRMFGGNSNWRDHILFYEYFHGDTGLGLGASHQTG